MSSVMNYHPNIYPSFRSLGSKGRILLGMLLHVGSNLLFTMSHMDHVGKHAESSLQVHGLHLFVNKFSLHRPSWSPNGLCTALDSLV